MARLVGSLVLIVLSTLAAPFGVHAYSGDSAPDGNAAFAAQEAGPSEDSPGDAWGEVVIWGVFGLGIFALAGGALYFFKRQVGGFPENPSWVAPITIMRSKDLPDEGDFGDQSPSHQAHAEH
jgi:hypothetical protein